jgi:SAM domain (Sterile alpha motif)
MQQIGNWLEKLGMSEYAERFAENRIDFSVLPDLTDQDLEKLGVILGDRRKMLRAIAALTAAPAAAVEVSAWTRLALRRQKTRNGQHCRRPKGLMRHTAMSCFPSHATTLA